MGLMMRTRVTFSLLADRFLRSLDLRDWVYYRHWLKSCLALTVRNLEDIYGSLHKKLPLARVDARWILEGNIGYFKRYHWQTFPPSAVDELEQLFLLYRQYQRELKQIYWKKPDPRSELFQRFWRESGHR